uniref:RNA helicase n=1 Tax=Globodera rostochiensis TaxID=31243 RepID=A0A914I9J1_GLORO
MEFGDRDSQTDRDTPPVQQMSDPGPDHRINRKKLENIERLQRKNEAKISKNKAKKLAQLSARKRIKQTRESLFEMLQQYQLDNGSMNLLTSIAGNKKENCNQKQKSEVVRKLRNSAITSKLTAVHAKKICLRRMSNNRIGLKTQKSDQPAEKNLQNASTKMVKQFERKTKFSDDTLSRIKGRQIVVQRTESIETINENPAGYTSNGHLIGVTEPRRIAAISMASRVGYELHDSKVASYQIRYEGNQKLQVDFTLSRYSVIVIDEAHERSIYSDVLIGLLSRICVVRMKRGYPLKLIIMSATLRLQDFLRQRLFSNIQPKVINVEARQFPVTIYFERRTPNNYLEAVFKKVCKIHEEYPAGGILVFVTGQREVDHLVKLLGSKYRRTPSSSVKKRQPKKHCRDHEEHDNKIEEAEEQMVFDNDEFGTCDMDDGNDEQNDGILGAMHPFNTEQPSTSSLFDKCPPLLPIPLYSLLPVHLQQRVFRETPEDGSRICVISTNVAETSLTIPNVRYVIDCGKEKRREYDPASADQRTGRAGRVQSGYAFRLYSSAVYEDMRDYSAPEILNKPIDQLILMLKAMNFTKMDNFPFPTPPKLDQIKSAELRLTQLGALKAQQNGLLNITPLGQSLAQLPLAPAFAKVVVSSVRDGLLPYSVTLEEGGTDETRKSVSEMVKQRRLWCAIGEARLFGDLTVILNIVGAADYARENESAVKALGLRSKALKEINKQRNQMDPPSQEQLRKLRHIMVKCLPDKLAKKDSSPDAPKGAYKTQQLKDYVFIDENSVLYMEQPDYVLYQEIVQLENKKCLKHLSFVEPEWIPNFC